MGALDEGHFIAELENGMKLDSIELSSEEEPATTAIEDAVKVLLHGLGRILTEKVLEKRRFGLQRHFEKEPKIGRIDYSCLKCRSVLHLQSLLLPNFPSRTKICYRQKVKDIVQGALFPEAGLENTVGHAGGAGGLVVKCHVGYVPSGLRVVGLSKLSRVADVFAKRLQEPNRLANEVCSALHHGIMPAGVAVVLQCLHIHFPDLESAFLDPSHQAWVKALVCSGSGVLKMNMLMSGMIFRCKTSTIVESINPGMITAVASIISSLGEDPLRKELIGTPGRFVKWLLNFQNTNMDMKLNPVHLNPDVEISFKKKQMQSELNLSFWSQFNSTFYGFKLQVQERLTRQIAETVSSLLGRDVMVVVEANHTCMISRGIEKCGSNTATIAALGQYSTDPVARATFLQSIPNTSISQL
ncbi:hypothetical protein FNV43_RR23025 [Rhamnella rubrinervis]|uniref:GTP cyclohydrolase 1 n=1 Tax=Rhamnella rubrinervis TaxID=2594499 RepID=A0A8K0DX71_9ROSA|nr:hypothetical protein FNV43_RR23025 [Rhamnella rubrinervis]